MKFKKIRYSSPVKWLIIYTVLITAVSLLASSIIKIEDDVVNDEKIDSVVVKSVAVKEETKAGIIEKEAVKVKRNEILNNLTEKYNAIDFNELDYNFTYDYQKNLKKKNVLFYLLIEDIFEEKRNIFIKSQKVSSNLNILLKIKCNDLPVDSIMNYKYFVYMVANISDITKILFNTKAEVVSNSGKNEEAYITFDTNSEGLLIQGECLEILSE